MKNSLIKITVFIFLFLVLTQTALAVGIGVKPKKIDLDVGVGKIVKTEMLIMNVSKQPAIYQVYLDGLTDFVSVSPTDFKLEPNANQIVTVTVKAKSPGILATNISAVARPLSVGGLPAASGVKIPITITSSGIPILWWVIFGIIFGVCLLVFFMIKFKRGKNTLNVNKLHKPNLLP